MCGQQTALAQPRQALEVSAGYTFLRDVHADVDFPRGWYAAVGVRVAGPLWAIGHIDASFQTLSLEAGEVALSVHAGMVGVRAATRVGPFVEFGQVTLGPVRGRGAAFGTESTDTRLGIQPGAGLDYAFRRRLALRLEIDIRRIPSKDETEIRFGAGIVMAIR